MIVLLPLTALYDNVLQCAAFHGSAGGQQCKQPEGLQQKAYVHLPARQIAAEDAKRHILYGGEGQQADDRPYSSRQKGERNDRAAEKIEERRDDQTDSLRGNGIENGQIDHHVKRSDNKQRQNHGEYGKKPGSRIGGKREAVGLWKKKGCGQDRHTAQHRL